MASELPAGPELDAEVARVVFGRTGLGYYGPPTDGSLWEHARSVRYDTPEEARASYQRIYDARAGGARSGHATPDEMPFDLCYWEEGWGPLLVDEYSTDWAAMGILVAHLTGQGWDVVMHAYRPSAHAYARLERSDSVIERYTAHGAHVPHAVALAALQAARPPEHS